MSESNITTLYKGEFVLVDLVDETIELTVENNVYSYSESYELLDELQKSCDIIKKEKSETYSQQMQDELEPIEEPLDSKTKLHDELGVMSSGYYESYPNNLPRLIKEMEDRNNLINNKETEVEQDTDDRM